METQARILVVEDNSLIAFHIERMLTELGYEVISAVASGERAVEKTATDRPDLVLMDIKLAGRMDGIEAAGRIRALCDVPIIYATAHSDAQLIERSKSTQPYGYLLKPFGEKELGAAIEIALYKHSMEQTSKETNKQLEQEMAERVQAEEALRRRAEELTALQATVLDITTAHDLPILLHSIVERAADLLGASSGGLYLCEPDQEQVRCVVSYNTPHDYSGTVLRYGEGAAGTVAQTGEPLIIDDYRLWSGRADAYEEEQPFTAVLSAPMVWQGQVTGVLHVLHDVEQQRFTQADLELLTLFANHAAVAVENTRLYEQAQTEITERAQAVAALRESEARYRTLFEQANDAIHIDNEYDNIIDVNRRACEMLGYSREELLSMMVPDLQAPEVRGTAGEVVKTELAHHGNSIFETVNIHHDGTRIPVEVSVSQVTGLGGDLYISIVRDITERKRAEAALTEYSERLEEMVEMRTRELQDAQERLIRQEKLALLGQLAGSVSHELRNPLTIISNAVYYLKMVLPGNEADETISEYLDIIASEVRDASKIISDLLDFSRIRPADKEKIAVSDLVTRVLEKHPAPEGVEVKVELATDLPALHVDPRQIEQVLINLVTNAFQAMTSSSSAKTSEGGEMIVSAGAAGEQVQISVTDTGHGISDEHISKLFDPLFTTKAQGIGLGLTVSKTLVEANGGSIQVQSQERVGTTFTILLPIAQHGRNA